MVRLIFSIRSLWPQSNLLKRAALPPIFLALSLFCASAASNAASVMILGDSLSASYGIPSDSGWVALLDQRLQQTAPTTELVNASISGETTGGALARLPALLSRHQPSLVVIELGGNDGLRGFPINRMRQNLQDLIELAHDNNAQVLLVGMKIPPNYGKRYTDAFYGSFTDLAQQYQLPLVPFLLEGVATKPGLMQADGIHPTAAAQAQLLDNVWPHLQALLK